MTHKAIDALTAEEQAELANFAVREGDKSIVAAAARLIRRGLRIEKERAARKQAVLETASASPEVIAA
jgi:hypothetical protein